jgi:FHA domain
MPLQTPFGPLFTLDELVLEARHAMAELEARTTAPVLLVVAPAEPWAALPGPPIAGVVQMFPTLVVPVPAFRTGELTFGSGKDCALALPFAAISEEHGFLRCSPAGWELGDFGSKNGSYVDGVRVLRGAVAHLRDGATVRLGDVTARFRLPASLMAELHRRMSR